MTGCIYMYQRKHEHVKTCLPADAHWKTPENTVPGNARKRDENIDRQETSVYLDSPELTVPENTRRFLQTKENMIFTKSSSNSVHWKNKRFLAFTCICCQRKCKKTSVNAGTHNNFPAFTERWTQENLRFLEFPWIRHSRKIQENRRKHLWTREYTMLSVR